RSTTTGSFLTPDGSFLVQGDYTLTPGKGGSNKLIRILHGDGRFGFSEPLTFDSVVELIGHHQHQSLAQYNSKLDVRLLFPVSRFQQDQLLKEVTLEEVGRRLQEYHSQFQEQSRQYDRLQEDYARTSQEIQMKRTAIEAFNETISIFEEQCHTQERQRQDQAGPEAGPERVLLTYERLKERLSEIHLSRQRLEEELRSQDQELRQAQQQMSGLRPHLLRLRRLRDQHLLWLNRRGVRQRRISDWLGMRSPEEERSSCLSLPHHDERSWFVGDLKRGEAEELLLGRPDGSFLVRESSRKGCYACSVVVEGVVTALRGAADADGGFGFAEPFDRHASLKELVLHYRRASLAQHNRALDVRLAFPVHAHTPSGRGVRPRPR
uniref:SH2 domain-containing protein n=1 Tax=Tetraodon nigroviridis TaxID=99883 RepID=H3CEC8_TETNG